MTNRSDQVTSIDSLIAVLDGKHYLLTDDFSISIDKVPNGQLEISFEATLGYVAYNRILSHDKVFDIKFQIGRLMNGSAKVIAQVACSVAEPTNLATTYTLTMRAISELPVIHTMENAA